MTLIKRYSNRKLYDTEARQYVKIEEIAAMIRRGENVRVVDHVHGTDLTTAILLQVILEQEKSIGGMLPNSILKRIIASGESAFEVMHIALNAFTNPMLFAEDDILRRLNLLVKKGAIDEAERNRLAEMLLAEDLRRANSDWNMETLTHTGDSPASLEEINQLERELERLQSELESLSNQSTK